MDEHLHNTNPPFRPDHELPASFEPPQPAPLPPAPTPQPAPVAAPSVFRDDTDRPIAVTEVYSSYGIEYFIMLISLGVAAIGLASLLNAVVDMSSKSAGLASSFLNPYAEAALIVGFPIFAYLFLRLEAKEEADKSLLSDASRRRSIQIIMVISFAVLIGELINYVGSLLSGGSYSVLTPGTGSNSWWVRFLHAFINIVIAGGIFGYYWYKLHRKTGPNLR